MAGSPATAATARVRVVFLPGGAAEDLFFPPPSQIPGESPNPSRVGRRRRPARRSLLGDATWGSLVLRESGCEVGERSSAASPRGDFLCRVCVPAGVCLDGVMLCCGKVVACHGGSAPEPGWRGIGFLFPSTAPRRAPQMPPCADTGAAPGASNSRPWCSAVLLRRSSRQLSFCFSVSKEGGSAADVVCLWCDEDR